MSSFDLQLTNSLLSEIYGQELLLNQYAAIQPDLVRAVMIQSYIYCCILESIRKL